MRVTICELPHEPAPLEAVWAALRQHVAVAGSDLVLLPELAMVEPVWESERFDPERWEAIEEQSAKWLWRLHDLRAPYVVGTRPVRSHGRRFNEGYLWSAPADLIPLRRKAFLPDEPGGWEAHWFHRGVEEFPTYQVGRWSFGLNICTELWALETYGAYGTEKVSMILSPRATAAATADKWLSVGVVAAVRTGAYSISSNRVDPSGACGGGGWIIDPEGRVVARTTAETPFATAELDLERTAAAKEGYPRYVFAATSR